MLLYITTIISICFFIILLVDFVPQFRTWVSRIHIGRYSTEKECEIQVQKKALQWLKNTPTIKLTDNDRFIVWDILKGNYKRNAIQSWQQAALVLGLQDSNKVVGNSVIQKELTTFFYSKINQDGSWKHKPKDVDEVILAYALLSLDFLPQEKFQSAYDEVWNLIQAYKGTDGTIQYRKHVADFRFVDTIGFICPFLVLYGQKFNKLEAIDLAIHQIKSYVSFGFDDYFLPCHTYTVSNKIGVGLYGWGRGLGWFAIGLIDAWQYLDATHPQKHELEEIVTKFAQTILRFQNKNGGWNWLVTHEGARTDSSATATLGYYLQQASVIPSVSEEANLVVKKAKDYLKKVTRRSGAIDFSQGDTKGIGVYANTFDILPFTQGFALRMFANKNERTK